MKLRISAGAACSLARLAIVARIISGIVIDMPELLNAGWLSILLGGLFALFPAFAIAQLKKNGKNRFPRIIPAAFFAIAVYDAAVVSASIADSASFMALNRTAAVYLMIPQLLLCMVCMRLNGDALGASAGIWNKILPCLLLLVFILQAKDYRTEWLTPVFGPGASSILDGALRAAGWFTLPTALYIAAEPEVGGEKTQLRPVKTLVYGILFATLIAFSFFMMTPAIAEEKLFGRAFRLDALLANGRAGLGLQVPIITLWYVGLFYALLTDLFAAAVLLQSVLPGWNRDGCILLTVIIAALLAAGRFCEKSAALSVAKWLYALQCVLLAAAMLIQLKQKGDEPSCAG